MNIGVMYTNFNTIICSIILEVLPEYVYFAPSTSEPTTVSISASVYVDTTTMLDSSRADTKLGRYQTGGIPH